MSGGSDCFAYDAAGGLACEGVALARIAAEVGTPAYVYAAGGMRRRLGVYRKALEGRDALFCYALKANSNLAVIRTLAQEGAGADTVSGGEIERALAAGVAPRRIVFAGIAKTDDEIRLGLGHDILQFNVESLPELERIAAIARDMGRTARVALRVNPDIEAATLAKISTGRKGDKFGVGIGRAFAVFERMRELEGVRPQGVHLHIGSQITRLEPFEAAYARGIELYRALNDAGFGLTHLDLGGGFGVRYSDETPVEPAAFRAMLERRLGDLACRLIFEPGRALVAEAGVLLARVIYMKEEDGRRFLVLDAGMNVLLRPALYDAYHEVVPVRRPAAGEPLLPTDVVGPICESSDIFGRDRPLPRLAPGDLVALTAAGAYGAVMASDYNTRPSAAEVLVDEGRFAVIRPGRSPAEQFAAERLPPWLAAGDAEDPADRRRGSRDG